MSPPPCTQAQREYIDGLHERSRYSWQDVLSLAEEIACREIRDIGELDIEEASELIEALKEED